MNYFTKEYWYVGWIPYLKFIFNTKFPFISLTARKQTNEFWLISLNRWDKQPKNILKPFHYKKLTKDKYEEIFYSLLKSDEGKHIIFNYSFNGRW